MTRRAPRLLLAGAIACVLAAPVLAQSGGLSVHVVEAESGEPLPGVTVALSNTQHLSAPTALITDREGVALFPVLRAGRGYVIEVSLAGFATLRRTDIRIAIGITERELIQLGASIQERVKVTGATGAVDLNKVGGTTRLTDEFIDDLPTPGRFYQDVLTLAPGVNDEDGDGNPNVHGSRTRDFKAEVGGVSNVDPLTGQWLSRINYDSIEELEILTTGAGVEFGRAQGGFARVLQKQGTNTFEGLFGFQYRSSKLDGDGAGNASPITPAPDFESLQPSLQLSGPVVKDRLWYRVSYDFIKRETPIDILTSIEVSTRRQQVMANQLTWQVSPRNKVAFQYQSDPLELDNIGLRTLVSPGSTRTLTRDSRSLSVTWTAPQSPRVLFDTTIAFQNVEQDLIPTPPPGELVLQECVAFPLLSALRDVRCTNIDTLGITGRHPENLLDERQRFTLRSQATVFRNIGGHNNVFKIGFSVENEQYERDLTRRPEVTWDPEVNLFQNPFGFATVVIPLPERAVDRSDGVSAAVWFEDQWRPMQNLSVTLGLRLDREEVSSKGKKHFDPVAEAELYRQRIEEQIALGQLPAFCLEDPRNNQCGQRLRNLAAEVFTAHEDPRGFRNEIADFFGLPAVVIDYADVLDPFLRTWKNARTPESFEIRNSNLAPRLAVAWDPWSDGRTKLSLTAGRYYDKIFLAVPLIELEPVEVTLGQRGFSSLRGSFFACRVGNAPCSPSVNLPNVLFEADDDDPTILPPATRRVDRNLRTPYSDEWTVGFEREIFPETSIRLTWVRRKFEDQFQDIDINTRNGFVANPAWSAILLIGNFNSAEYRSMALELIRRRYRNWELQTSYIWSKAFGDAEDYDLLNGDDQRLREQERGFLSYDQRHVFRLNATKQVSNWRFGTVLRWESGLPYSVLTATYRSFFIPQLYTFNDRGFRARALSYPTGQRNSERNADFWTVDLLVSREIRLGADKLLGLRAEAFNVFNDDTLRVVSETDSQTVGERRFGRQFQLTLRLSF